jgi:hypothetical protein
MARPRRGEWLFWVKMRFATSLGNFGGGEAAAGSVSSVLIPTYILRRNSRARLALNPGRPPARLPPVSAPSSHGPTQPDLFTPKRGGVR